MKKILVTGAAGFIGFHLCKLLLERNYEVIGLDNLNNYYNVDLKLERLNILGISRELNEQRQNLSNRYNNFIFFKIDLAYEIERLKNLFNEFKFDYIVHLAAQAGVRYSIENPRAYLDSNVIGFFNLLDTAKNKKFNNFIYASSSSVYGNSKKIPFSVEDRVDFPVSFYAATKKSNELMAHVYSYLFGMKCVGLRFFTVYGPLGRPDMAYFKFAKRILQDEEIEVFNYGNLKRDFTYIDDITESVARLIEKFEEINFYNSEINSHYKIYNIGASQPVNLKDFIYELEKAIGKKAKIKYLPMQPGDVECTYADCDDLEKTINFRPSIPLSIGLKRFADWFINSKYSL